MRHDRSSRPAVESLEGRALLTADFTSAVGIGGASVVAGATAVDAAGNTVVAGSFQGTVDFNPGAGITSLSSGGTQAAFVAKYTPAGALIWARAFTQSAGSSGTAKALDLGPAGEVYLAGSFAGAADFNPGSGTALLASAGGQDAFLVKLDGAGNYAWARRWGGTGADSANALAVSGAGNVAVLGSFAGTVDLDPGSGVLSRTGLGTSDLALQLFDPAGTLTRVNQIGGSVTEAGYAVDFDAAGSLFVGGSFSGTVDFDPGAGVSNLISAGGTDAFVAKYTAAGALAWARRWGNASFSEVVTALASDGANVVATGNFQGTVDFDPGAGVSNLTSAGLADAYAVKLDGSGAFAWAASFGSAGSETGLGAAADSSGAVYLAGNFQGTVDFAPGPGVVNLTSAGTSGDYDGYVVKLDSGGGYQWAKQAGGAGYDTAAAVALGGGSIALVGRYTGPAAFGGLTLASAGSVSMYVSRLAPPTGTGTASLTAGSTGTGAPTITSTAGTAGTTSSLGTTPTAGAFTSDKVTWVAPEVMTAGSLDFGRTAVSLSTRSRARLAPRGRSTSPSPIS